MKKSRINPISDKRKAQIILEKELAYKLYNKQGGKCANCHKPLSWRSAKHEIKFRSQGGSPIDEKNCKLLCGDCHDFAHHLTKVDPASYWD